MPDAPRLSRALSHPLSRMSNLPTTSKRFGLPEKCNLLNRHKKPANRTTSTAARDDLFAHIPKGAAGWKIDNLADQVVVVSARLGAAELAQNHEKSTNFKLPSPLSAPVLAERSPGPGITVIPRHCWKSGEMARRAFEHVGLAGGLRVVVSDRFSGRGHSNSTANLRGTALAVFELADRKPDKAWISRTCADIEPTDAPMEDGLVRLWDYKAGTACSVPYSVPELTYIAISPAGRTLRTDDVDLNRPRYSPTQRRDVKAAMDGVLRALQEGDAPALAEAATLSIEINDFFFPKPELGLLRELKRAGVVLGYAGCHSGTSTGVMAETGDIGPLMSRLSKELGAGYTLMGWTTSGRGGSVSGADVVVNRT